MVQAPSGEQVNGLVHSHAYRARRRDGLLSMVRLPLAGRSYAAEMIPALGRLPLIEQAEDGTKCPYCDSDRHVCVFKDADEYTVCALCLFYALDLPFGWNLSRSLENAIAIRESARSLPPRRRL